MNYEDTFSTLINNLTAEGRYRIFRTVERSVGDFPRAVWKGAQGPRPIVIWCSNDYLGMGHHPDVLRAAEQALFRYGTGAGGTRNISGTHEPIIELERAVARATGKEAGLVFSSGYLANETGLSTLARVLPGLVILSDELNHASMIEGIRLGRGEKRIFRHNDLVDLERQLEQLDPAIPKLIAFESVYSMEGDFAPVQEILTLAKKYGALTYVDETHAVGLYGLCGGGVVQERQLTRFVDFIQGGLGKAYGVIGGFITGSATAIDVIRSYGPGFIFTTSLPPATAAAALKSVRWLFHSSEERVSHREVVKDTKDALRAANIQFFDGGTHIIPVHVGNSFRCQAIADRMLNERGIYIQPINYPTVPRGTERLRITPTPFHTPEMIKELVSGLIEAFHATQSETRSEAQLSTLQQSVSQQTVDPQVLFEKVGLQNVTVQELLPKTAAL